jgi:hypothetical protein
LIETEQMAAALEAEGLDIAGTIQLIDDFFEWGLPTM